MADDDERESGGEASDSDSEVDEVAEEDCYKIDDVGNDDDDEEDSG